MSESLVVRAYNAMFGDAVLVSVPDRAPTGEVVTRHVLFDVGNVTRNSDDVLKTIVADVVARTGGVVDLYVMTHEHLDHVAGLLAADRAGIELTARHAWLTGSADPNYYLEHEAAHRQKKSHLDELALAADHLSLEQGDDADWLSWMIENNGGPADPGSLGLKTDDCVDHLRQLATPNRPDYVDRTTSLDGKHPFTELTFRILAPEEDTSVYYGQPGPRLAVADAAGPAANAEPDDALVPPVGIDAGAFFDLVRSRGRTNRQSVLAIDQANNNTSVVLELEWRGWRLLFGGDAEEISWTKMLEAGLLRPVHFLKVAHHGSINGTTAEMLETVFPLPAPDDSLRRAVVSTHEHDWESVPNPKTLRAYRERVTLLDTRDVDPGAAIEIAFVSRL